MLTREQFYKSKQWESFRKVIIEQRTETDGTYVLKATVSSSGVTYAWVEG